MSSSSRSFIVAALLVFAMCACQVTSRTLNQETMLQRHQQRMAQCGRIYRDDVEKEMRFKIFSNNVKYIESFNNAGNRPYKLTVNQFADQTNEEFKAARNGFKVPYSVLESTRATPFRYENVTVIPSSMDWRKKGAVTPVKDQGQCGKLFKHPYFYLTVSGTCKLQSRGAKVSFLIFF
ncbi:putative fruit bromelain [Helianthus debilis subsp. tardiflorus]